ncbi:MAG TPA: S9 family peptidase [Bacteroidales bacterium]|nr:S9 family peptidase [Bacteroidales bacterium]
MKKILFFFYLLIINTFAFAQTDEGLLTIDRIFNSPEFRGQRSGSIQWLPDGNGYTAIEASTSVKKGVDIVKVDPKTGAKVVLASTQDLTPKGLNAPIDIEDYSWSPDGTKLLIFNNGRQVWRYNTRGDYWVLDLTTKSLNQLGKSLPSSSLMFAKISPDGTRAAYVSKHNIYVENLSNNEITPITTNGSNTLINGTFDWVYEEEFDCRDGFRWSPDNKRIAYWQLDASGVRDFYMINNTDSLYSYIIPVQYPKAGQTLSSCRVGVISADGGNTVWMKLQGDPRNNYVPRMEWAASSEEVIIQYLNRLQNTNQVFLGNVLTGDLNNILTETDAAWLDPVDDLKWLDKGKSFTWISERSGWKHIYTVSRDGKTIKPITSGDFDVMEIKLIDDKKGYVYYIASPENSIQKYLWRIKMNGKGKPERLTPASFSGTNSYDISSNATWAIHSFSAYENPNESYLISLPDHKVVKPLVDNAKLKANYAKLKKLPVEFFKVTIDGNIDLDGFMIKPYNFDPTKKYPVLFYVYSEPASTTVNDRWGGSGYLWHLMLAQKGYIVISIDGRGTPSPKGREWRKSIYLKIGVLNSSDQAKAAVEVGKKFNFIDTNRFGIWGWSGGGSATLNAMFRYPDIYKTGMSVAPVADIHLYDAIYQERFTSTPQLEPDVYIQGSPITFAQNLKGNLLIVHGTGDDNVHYQGTEKLFNKLIENNKHFTMLVYPNRTHSIREGKGTTIHLYNELTRYLLENLEAGGK